VSTVFNHGQLRLYLLNLLEESPRHGYEVIRTLEDQFYGLYSPSAGTVYPRLQRLKADGLVTYSREGGRNVYRLTDEGRNELDKRRGELAELQAEIRSSAKGLADQIKAGVQGSVQDVRAELKQLAREMRVQERHRNRTERTPGGAAEVVESLSSAFSSVMPGRSPDPHGADPHGAPAKRKRRASKTSAADLERRTAGLAALVRELTRAAAPTQPQIDEGLRIVDETMERLRAAFPTADAPRG